MERINAMKRPQVLKELQEYKKYKGKTQKEIGELGGIAVLRKELFKLETKKLKTVQEPVQDISHEHFPRDILKEIACINPQTKLKMCALNKSTRSLCTKEDQDRARAHINAQNMVTMIEMYNKYKGDGMISLLYTHTDDIHTEFKRLFKFEDNPYTEIDFTYVNKDWIVNVAADDMYVRKITRQNLINILTDEIFDNQHGKNVAFKDRNVNELLYANLLKNAKRNKPIPRAYLTFYELLQNCSSF